MRPRFFLVRPYDKAVSSVDGVRTLGPKRSFEREDELLVQLAHAAGHLSPGRSKRVLAEYLDR